MSRLRVLVLGPGCDPEQVSIPFVTYSHAAALAQLHDVTLVARSSLRTLCAAQTRHFAHRGGPDATARAHLCLEFAQDFQIQLRQPGVDRFRYPFSVAFEWHAWRQLRRRIFAGEFDVVLRIVPMTAVLPSPFAFFLRKGPIPFVIGPINGGLPCAAGFQPGREPEGMDLQLEESISISAFCSLHLSPRGGDHSRFIPNVCRVCRAIATNYFLSRRTALSRSLCSDDARSPEPGAKLELIFVGGLIPCKACDLALARGCSPFAKRFGPLYRPRRWPGTEPPRAACEIPWDREGCFLLWLGEPCGGPQAATICGCARVSIGSRLRRRRGL